MEGLLPFLGTDGQSGRRHGDFFQAYVSKGFWTTHFYFLIRTSTPFRGAAIHKHMQARAIETMLKIKPVM